MVSVGAPVCEPRGSFRKKEPDGQATPACEGSGPAGYEQDMGMAPKEVKKPGDGADCREIKGPCRDHWGSDSHS